MTLTVEATEDASGALAGAGAFLRARPVEHNLILTLLEERAANPVPGRYWLARQAGAVCGVAFQSPLDFPMTLTPMSVEVASAIVEAVATAGVDLPGVSGEAASAAAFAGHWAEVSRSGAYPVAGQRLYHLRHLQLPGGIVGRLRAAGEEDAPVVAAWVADFAAFIGESGLPAEVLARRIANGQAWLWDDQQPVCLALHSVPVAGVTRIQTVYTPDTLRRRGYASACVGQLTRRLVDSGQECILYTDLGNPTSNAVYRRLGYEPVVEALRYRFTKPQLQIR